MAYAGPCHKNNIACGGDAELRIILDILLAGFGGGSGQWRYLGEGLPGGGDVVGLGGLYKGSTMIRLGRNSGGGGAAVQVGASGGGG